MPTQQHQKPPPGFIYIEDYVDDDGSVLPGIASRLGISVSTYRKWRMAGLGPDTIRPRKRVMAREDAVERYLSGLEQSARAPSDNPEMRPAEPRRRAA